MHVYLRTDRLLLRRLTMDDVENLVSLDADPEVMGLLTGGKPTPREVCSRRPGSGTCAPSISAGMTPIEGIEHGEVEYELRRADWTPRRASDPP
jgi:hypothetical protein